MDEELPRNQSSAERSSLIRWYKIWAKALVMPAERNFQVIVSDGRLNGLRSLLWLILITIISFEFPVIFKLSRGELHGPDRIEVLVPFLIIPLLFFMLIFVLASVGLIHFLARRLKGVGAAGPLLGVLCTGLAPGVVAASLISFLPPGNYTVFLLLAFAAYILFLLVVAAKTIYQFSWKKAIVSVLGAGLLLSAIFLFYSALRY
jgi:hypothetical protein